MKIVERLNKIIENMLKEKGLNSGDVYAEEGPGGWSIKSFPRRDFITVREKVSFGGRREVSMKASKILKNNGWEFFATPANRPYGDVFLRLKGRGKPVSVVLEDWEIDALKFGRLKILVRPPSLKLSKASQIVIDNGLEEYMRVSVFGDLVLRNDFILENFWAMAGFLNQEEMDDALDLTRYKEEYSLVIFLGKEVQ